MIQSGCKTLAQYGMQVDIASDHLQVVYEDEHLIAINKPEGLLVHRSEIDRRETRFALQLLRDQVGRRVYPLHRLDKPTSGVLLFAFDPETARVMGKLMMEGGLQKHYVAIVRGVTDADGTIDYALKEQHDRYADPRIRSQTPKAKINNTGVNNTGVNNTGVNKTGVNITGTNGRDKPEADQDRLAQAAMTKYQRLVQCEVNIPVGRYDTARYSLVALQPKTGRKHQLRRHMKHIFHPIVGDTTHGDGKHNKMFREHLNCHRLMLAATHVSFEHPYYRHDVHVSATPTASFLDAVNRLGLC